MEKVDISFIIPAYNSINEISVTLNSIYQRCKYTYEIILIDDGSDDGTLDFISEHYEFISQLKTFRQKNQGVSVARNKGIEIAQGKYIYFVDSDDFVFNIENIEEMLEFALENNIDIVLGSAIEINGINCKTINRPEHLQKQIIAGEDFLREVLSTKTHNGAVWGSLYKTDFIRMEQCYFPPGLIHEDELWSIQTIKHANKVSYYPVLTYCYVRNDDSITNQKNKSKNGYNLFEIAKNIKNISNKSSNNTRLLLDNYAAMLALSGFSMVEDPNEKYINELGYFLRKCNLKGKNKFKYLLFSFNPQLYLRVRKKVKQYDNS